MYIGLNDEAIPLDGCNL